MRNRLRSVGCGLLGEWILFSRALPSCAAAPIALSPAPVDHTSHYKTSRAFLHRSNLPTNSTSHHFRTGPALRQNRASSHFPVNVGSFSELESPDDLLPSKGDGEGETLLSKEFRQLDGVREKLDKKTGGRRKIKPNLQPSFTFAAYVNDSPILQELIRHGVNLTKWEKGQIPDEVMQMDPQRDLAPIVRRLRQLGVAYDEEIGQILTQNPFILIHGPSSFKDKTDYFLRKKFSKEQLVVIMKGAPQLFSRTVETIDARLGFFQSSFALTGDQIRETVVAYPGLFRIELSYVKKVNFHMNKFLGFKPNEIRELFITVPDIFSLKNEHLQRRFDQLHNTMMIPHQSLVKFPYLLKVPLIVVKQRHKLLSTLGKANYDPLDDDYTTLAAFTDYDDERFAKEIAGVDFETYKDFLKTL